VDSAWRKSCRTEASPRTLAALDLRHACRVGRVRQEDLETLAALGERAASDLLGALNTPFADWHEWCARAPWTFGLAARTSLVALNYAVSHRGRKDSGVYWREELDAAELLLCLSPGAHHSGGLPARFAVGNLHRVIDREDRDSRGESPDPLDVAVELGRGCVEKLSFSRETSAGVFVYERADDPPRESVPLAQVLHSLANEIPQGDLLEHLLRDLSSLLVRGEDSLRERVVERGLAVELAAEDRHASVEP